MRDSRFRTAPRWLAIVAAGTAFALAGCSAIGGDDPEPAGSGGTGGATSQIGGTVTLITHDSFNVDADLLAKFEADTGITLKILEQPDAGTLANQLVLTKGSPLADVVYGIDNTFASRVVDADILSPYSPSDGADDVARFALDGAGAELLTAVDFGDVCINVDHRWYAERDIPEPVTLEDLTKKQYAGQLVVQNPATSSPGLAFLFATIGAFGEDGWQDYWRALAANDIKVANSWTDAYSVDFSGSSGEGPRPLVVSYASSPPYEVPEGSDEAPTGSLLETCFRQVEYAGILTGTKNEAGAKAVVDFLVSKEFQESLPGQMYMYPVRSDVELPAEWAKFAQVADEPFSVSPTQIDANRDAWLKAWADIVIG